MIRHRRQFFSKHYLGFDLLRIFALQASCDENERSLSEVRTMILKMTSVETDQIPQIPPLKTKLKLISH